MFHNDSCNRFPVGLPLMCGLFRNVTNTYDQNQILADYRRK